MIGAQSHPEDWFHFMTELEDASEHLVQLIEELRRAGAVDRAEFAIDLGHVCAHLNRAWHRHDHPGELSDEAWTKASEFPDNLSPV